jgi:CubicO group peptidase (beta-lactamase class C family)
MSGSGYLRNSVLPGLKKIVITFLLFFLYCGCGQQEPVNQTESDGKISKDTTQVVKEIVYIPFDTVLQHKLLKLVNSGDFSGSVIITAKDGRQFESSTGFADYEKKILNSDSVFFQVASLTKIFTALATLNLEQTGKLKFTDLFTKHLKTKLPYNNITVRNLLDHTSGIPDYIDLVGKYWKGKSGPINTQIFQLYLDNKIVGKSPPGKYFAYSNINYIILSSLIEDLSGKSFEKYVRELTSDKWIGAEVFGRDEIKDSSIRVASAYLSTGKKYSKVPSGLIVPFEKRKGSGGLWITPFQFNEWLSSMFFKHDFYRNVLSDKTVLSKVGSSNYVLGWYTVKKKSSEYIYCYGKNPGMNSFCAYLPDEEITIALFSNTEIDSKAKGEQLVSALLK